MSVNFMIVSHNLLYYLYNIKLHLNFKYDHIGV